MKGIKNESRQLDLYDEDDDDDDDDSEYRHYLRRQRREKARRKELEIEKRAKERARARTVPRDVYSYSDEETSSLYSETTLSWDARCNGGDDVRFCGMTL